MISQKTISVVKSTAPILQEHGEALIKHFYKRMFKHNPEVLPFFNQAHQAASTQQKALAAAVAAYAANIDNLGALGEAVEVIAHKHASLQVKSEQYAIVGENLLASLKEVLGDGATDEVIEAWTEAYGALAEILVGREKEIYNENANKPGGWEGFRKFIVERKEKESSLITSFYLKPEDGGQVPSFKPGQYITVRVSTPDNSTTMRNYSLSDKPGQDYYRISVKRETGASAATPAGYVSNKLHSEIKVGDKVELGSPCGEFFFKSNERQDSPLVLLAAGVGITPIMSILQAALEAKPDRQIILVHGCLNEDVQAFKGVLEELAKKHSNLKVYFRYSEPAKSGVNREGTASTGLITASYLEPLLPSRNLDYYFCGPKPFMASIHHELIGWGVPNSHMNFEFFGPKQELEDSKAVKAA